MQKIKVLSLIIIFGVIHTGFSQTIEGVRKKTRKRATVHIASMEQVAPDSVPLFKIPNKNWNPPILKVNENDVIYREPAGFRKINLRTVREQSPAPDTTIQGLGDPGNIIPPDVNGAAGPDHLMITLNTQVRIQDKSGNNLFTTTLGGFWSSLPGSGATFDPKVLYDPYAKRWILVTASGSNPVISKLFIGVSATSDPLDDWYMYWIDTDDQNKAWFDYPSVGFNKKWITVSGNMFGNAYYRTIFVFDKIAAYNGEENVPYTRFATSEAFTIVPSITYDSSAEDMYCIATSNGNSAGYGYIKKFRISGSTDNPVFEYQGAIGVPETWDASAGQNGNFLPQLGSTEKINSVDSRMENVIYRNNKLWAVHHIFVPAGNPQRTAIQWWNLDTAGVILQRGRIEDTTNLFSYAFPTIAVNAHEDMLIGHDVFSSSQYAGAGYSFKTYYDDTNSVRTYYQYKDGEAPYYKDFGSGRNRWCDYSATCVDPINDVNFWTIQEYAASPQNTWGTWWASLIPSFPPVADFSADEILIPIGEDVNFSDLTTGVPTTWKWTFEGGEPDTSVLQNPVHIQYNQEGSFPVKLIVSNDLGNDTIEKEAYITASSTILPEVDFIADKEIVCTGMMVSFTDLTKYSPIQWEWQFDPSDVTFVDGTDNTSQNPKVVFDAAGNYSVTLTVWNLNGSSELTKFDMITGGGFEPFYNETFDTGSFSDNFWTVENPDNDVTWELYDLGKKDGTKIAAGVDFSHYYTIGERDRLISPPFNLEGMSSAALEFQHAYAQRFAGMTDSLIVYISGDCGENWTRVFSGGEDGSGNFATHEMTDNFWPVNYWDWCTAGWGASCIDIDLTPWAGRADVRIAFESYSNYGNPLMIDNISVSRFVGVDNQTSENQDLKIFPNPSNGSFTVLIPSNENFDQLKLIDFLGQTVFVKNITGQTKMVKVNPDQKLNSGIYFLKLTGSSKTTSKRVVVH